MDSVYVCNVYVCMYVCYIDHHCRLTTESSRTRRAFKGQGQAHAFSFFPLCMYIYVCVWRLGVVCLIIDAENPHVPFVLLSLPFEHDCMYVRTYK